jgi:peptidyl-prolyl cis-trans isomerase-like 2
MFSANVLYPSYQDPFEDYKTRLAKKLAKRAEGDTRGPVEEKKDEVNWFGVKVGSDKSALTLGEKGSGGVGKYLSLKRPQSSIEEITGADDTKKKRKIGFGNFEGW